MISEDKSTKKEHVYIKTDELASRYGLTPHSIRLWAGNGKQRREGFPKPRFRAGQLSWLMQDIIDWENGRQF
ncbi:MULTISPECIES: hypothetical protein [Providencia]|uniref:AlpA family phage regulatory protein n=1 Tax=Providencia rettgeri TaxID=587 RepID=A0A264VVI0_PRORE|nr:MULTISPECIES: hypothetical protein [Providencia]OZS75354.1 hypothetical protein CHI95_07575 [Providencia rettgeri]